MPEASGMILKNDEKMKQSKEQSSRGNLLVHFRVTNASLDSFCFCGWFTCHEYCNMFVKHVSEHEP